MPRSRVVVGVVGLLVGGLLASIFVLGCQRQPAVAGPDPEFHKHFPLNGTDDSPVLVRGGSAEGLSQAPWTAVVSDTCVNSSFSVNNVNLSAVSMDGLELITYPSGKKTLGPAQGVTAAGLTSNWSITFILRDHNDSIDSNRALQLSTYDPCSGTTPGTGTIQGKTLYLADVGSTSLNLDNQNSETNDGFYRLHYDVKKCAGDGTKDAVHSRCNHISQVTVSGIPSLIGSVSGPISGINPVPFQCRAGACDIGFGN